MKKKLPEKTMTRDQLKEILEVNYGLFKDEDNCFDYLTTLVIYLMKYEFDVEKGADEETGHLGTVEEGVPTAKPRLDDSTRGRRLLKKPKRLTICPHCDTPIPSASEICAFCLGMVY